MDLIECPRCGERYSPSYRKCPFCEEDLHGVRGGRRTEPRKKRAPSAKGAVVVLLLLIAALGLWYMLGEKPEVEPDVEADEPPRQEQEVQNEPENDDVFYDPSAGEQPTIPPENEEPHGGQTTPSTDTPTVSDDASGAVLNKNDFTLSVGETFAAKVSGTSQSVTWSIADPSIATVDANGKVTAVKSGQTTLTAKVGTRSLSATVRVKGGASSGTPGVNAADLAIRTNYGALSKNEDGKFDCTISSSDSARLSVSGTTAAVSWKSANTGIVKVDANGNLTPVKKGMTTVTATVGGAKVECVVRVK